MWAGKLELKNLFLFGFVDLVNPGDIFVGNLLDSVLGLESVVFGDVTVFLEAFDSIFEVSRRDVLGMLFDRELARGGYLD